MSVMMIVMLAVMGFVACSKVVANEDFFVARGYVVLFVAGLVATAGLLVR
jgi:hypothetical protein